VRAHVIVVAASLCALVACPEPGEFQGIIPVNQNPNRPALFPGALDGGGPTGLDNGGMSAPPPATASTAAAVAPPASDASSLDSLADSIDKQALTACSALAGDLGAGGTFASADDACNAALSAMSATIAKLGATAIIEVDFAPARCGVDLATVADCASRCDPTLASSGGMSIGCEPGRLRGTCSAQCNGACELAAPSRCSGTCNGSCDGGFNGKCTGMCNGKCDGSPSSGACNGACTGKCDAGSGSCGGACDGTCALQAADSCNGLCSGACSVEMQAPVCMGKVQLPSITADCAFSCAVKESSAPVCTRASVGVRISGASSAAAAASLRAALVKDLPGVSLVGQGMGDLVADLLATARQRGSSATVDRIAADVRAATAVTAAATQR
jgi:hypothetical protein